jgi:hypothetical protein
VSIGKTSKVASKNRKKVRRATPQVLLCGENSASGICPIQNGEYVELVPDGGREAETHRAVVARELSELRLADYREQKANRHSTNGGFLQHGTFETRMAFQAMAPFRRSSPPNTKSKDVVFTHSLSRKNSLVH